MTAYEEVADFIARRGPREVVEYRPSEQARQRAIELLEKEIGTKGRTLDLSIR